MKNFLVLFMSLFLHGLFSQRAFQDGLAIPTLKGVGAIPIGTTFTLPNYSGLLYTANKRSTLLNLIGGVASQGLYTPNLEYPTAQIYDLPDAKQPAISEDASIAGVTADHIARSQQKNVVQIYQEAINISYLDLANSGRLQGLNTNPDPADLVENEKAFQIDKKLKIISRDVNFVLHNGVYNLATTSAEINKTRGLLACIDDLGGAVIDAGSTSLTKTMVDNLLIAMHANGASFEDMVLLSDSAIKVQISNLYGFAPQDRNVGGVAVKQIETDFGNIMVDIDSDVPAGVLGCYDLAPLALTFQTVPEKGNLFYEELSKVGASEKGQLFGIIGFDHAPGFLHGKIENIT